mmetsp:Transcript_2004/g.2574  ORF Transcript_2004/g.2574 Transcript_2004/m.2574 type:complete len:88 (-) Transcript_2004:50-313(-)
MSTDIMIRRKRIQADTVYLVTLRLLKSCAPLSKTKKVANDWQVGKPRCRELREKYTCCLKSFLTDPLNASKLADKVFCIEIRKAFGI